MTRKFDPKSAPASFLHDGEPIDLTVLKFSELRDYVLARAEELDRLGTDLTAYLETRRAYLVNERARREAEEARARAEERRKRDEEDRRKREADQENARRAGNPDAFPTINVRTEKKVDPETYRTGLFMVLDMSIQVGKIDNKTAASLRADATTLKGINALADRLGMPRL